MRLIESYIFTRMLRAFVLTLVVLSATVWLSQALREFDLVSAMGQTIVTFLQITLLLLPALATVVSPVAILIGVIYTFRTLNDGSELVVINAAGTPQSAVLKPVLLVGLIGAIVMASMTLYFAPLSLRVWRTLITDVRGNIITHDPARRRVHVAGAGTDLPPAPAGTRRDNGGHLHVRQP